jgi:hypothetical protein
MHQLRKRRCSRLILSNGADVTENINRIIEKRILNKVAEVLLTLDCVINHLNKKQIKLAVLIANIGLVATLVDCVCKTKRIPSYLIINGLMSGDYLDEGKYATVINSYSKGIKEDYFRGLNNIVCLGDPRMDLYASSRQTRLINRDAPTVTIGTSAYNPIDLNSYLAEEFDFMHDVLSALCFFKGQGVQLQIVIKVRANGYREQYQHFVQEFFPGLAVEILDTIPFRSILEKTDLYISLYSQTLFEASCLGIPCLYYKKDSIVFGPPFDGCSGLVMADNEDDLVKAIADFRANHARFDDFLQTSVMERYIGPLDGACLERNLNIIYDLLKQHEVEGGRGIEQVIAKYG